jgi:hypothetical protein
LGVAPSRGFSGKGLVEITHDRRHLADGGAILQYQGRHHAARVDRPVGRRVLLALAEVDSDERNLQTLLGQENPHAP